MTEFIAIVVVNLVTTMIAVKQDFFNKSEASLLNKSSHLDPALGVIIIINVMDMILVTLCCAT
jgi:hypothetical protein